MMTGYPDAAVPELQAEAAPLRHRAYGVLALDYDHAGDALLRALALHLGDAFDERARAAWGRLYVAIASAMQAAHA